MTTKLGQAYRTTNKRIELTNDKKEKKEKREKT